MIAECTNTSKRPKGENFTILSASRLETPPRYHIIVQPDEPFVDPFFVTLLAAELWSIRKWKTACVNAAGFFPLFHTKQRGRGLDTFVAAIFDLTRQPGAES